MNGIKVFPPHQDLSMERPRPDTDEEEPASKEPSPKKRATRLDSYKKELNELFAKNSVDMIVLIMSFLSADEMFYVMSAADRKFMEEENLWGRVAGAKYGDELFGGYLKALTEPNASSVVPWVYNRRVTKRLNVFTVLLSIWASDQLCEFEHFKGKSYARQNDIKPSGHFFTFSRRLDCVYKYSSMEPKYFTFTFQSELEFRQGAPSALNLRIRFIKLKWPDSENVSGVHDKILQILYNEIPGFSRHERNFYEMLIPLPVEDNFARTTMLMRVFYRIFTIRETYIHTRFETEGGYTTHEYLRRKI